MARTKKCARKGRKLHNHQPINIPSTTENTLLGAKAKHKYIVTSDQQSSTQKNMPAPVARIARDLQLLNRHMIALSKHMTGCAQHIKNFEEKYPDQVHLIQGTKQYVVEAMEKWTKLPIVQADLMEKDNKEEEEITHDLERMELT